MSFSQRKIDNQEKAVLRSTLPWFGKWRREGLADLEAGLINAHTFEVKRAWDIGGCKPPCCPHSLLFEIKDGNYIFVENWAPLVNQASELEQKVIVESWPTSKELIRILLIGVVLPEHAEQSIELMDYFEIKGPDFIRNIAKNDIPDDIKRTLNAA